MQSLRVIFFCTPSADHATILLNYLIALYNNKILVVFTITTRTNETMLVLFALRLKLFAAQPSPTLRCFVKAPIRWHCLPEL